MKTNLITRTCIAVEIIACLVLAATMYYNAEQSMLHGNHRIDTALTWVIIMLGGVAYLIKAWTNPQTVGISMVIHLAFGLLLISIATVKLGFQPPY